MIAKDLAFVEVERFSALPRYPRENAIGLRELIAAMCTAVNEAHAKAGADEIMAKFKFCPVPADVREALNGIRDNFRNTAVRVTCGQCDGSGWMYGRENGTGQWKDQSYSTARRCPCGASTR